MCPVCAASAAAIYASATSAGGVTALLWKLCRVRRKQKVQKSETRRSTQHERQQTSASQSRI